MRVYNLFDGKVVFGFLSLWVIFVTALNWEEMAWPCEMPFAVCPSEQVCASREWSVSPAEGVCESGTPHPSGLGAWGGLVRDLSLCLTFLVQSFRCSLDANHLPPGCIRKCHHADANGLF